MTKHGQGIALKKSDWKVMSRRLKQSKDLHISSQKRSFEKHDKSHTLISHFQKNLFFICDLLSLYFRDSGFRCKRKLLQDNNCFYGEIWSHCHIIYSLWWRMHAWNLQTLEVCCCMLKLLHIYTINWHWMERCIFATALKIIAELSIQHVNMYNNHI